MSRFVSLKLTDDANCWLIDLERGVVSTMSGILADDGADTAETGHSRAERFSGIEFAIVSEMREDAFSGKYDK